MSDDLYLVTGSTGFVGSHLAARLVEQGRRVRVLVRDPARLPNAAWTDHVEVAVGDVGDRAALESALTGVRVAYYLVHAMTDGDDFAAVDRRQAQVFAASCDDAGVERIVYLGALVPAAGELTEHLASRQEVGEVFLASSVPTVELRAGMVMGQGSASYDLLEEVIRLMPVIVGPSWLNRHMQPIARADLLRYLVAVATLPPEVNRAFDVGGPDVLRYRDLLVAHARAGGRLPRPTVTFPVLLPHTLSLLAGGLTQGPTSLNAALVHSLSLDMVCTEHDIAEHVPDPPGGLTGVEQALREGAA